MAISRRRMLATTATAGAMLISRSGGLPNLLKTNVYAANNAALAYTDCVAPTFVNSYARFARPISDSGNYDQCMPAGRLRFRSNAAIVNILLRYNGLCTRTDSRNFLGAVFIDGVVSTSYQTPYAVNVTGGHHLNIVNGSAVDRLYEIVLPYADALEFGGVEVDQPYVVTAAAAKTGRVLLCYGDSITQGFLTSKVDATWPYLLAAARGFRLINMGYGGRVTVPTDGTAIANLAPDIITVLIGHNDFEAQTAAATYQANLQSLLTNIHNVNPNVPIYLSPPLNTTVSKAIPMSSYQTAAGAAVTALGYSQITSVAYASLCSTANMTDGVHPNDTGAAGMANAWSAVII